MKFKVGDMVIFGVHTTDLETGATNRLPVHGTIFRVSETETTFYDVREDNTMNCYQRFKALTLVINDGMLDDMVNL